MAYRALHARPVREHVAVTRQVKRVVPPALHEHQVTHVVVLLGARRGPSEVVLLLLLLLLLVVVHARTLTLLLLLRGLKHLLLVAVLKRKHLRRLVVVEHLVVILQLVRHLRVHLRSIFVRVLNMMVFSPVFLVLRVHLMIVEVRPFLVLTHVAVGGGVAEAVSGSVRALHPVRALRPVSGVSQGLSLLDALVYLMAIGANGFLKLVEVLLLLVERRRAQTVGGTRCTRRHRVLLVAGGVLVLARNHLSTGVTCTLLLRSKSWIKCLIFVVNWVQRVKNAGVATSL